jgi:hypothetical protein
LQIVNREQRFFFLIARVFGPGCRDPQSGNGVVRTCKGAVFSAGSSDLESARTNPSNPLRRSYQAGQILIDTISCFVSYGLPAGKGSMQYLDQYAYVYYLTDRYK